MRYLGYTKGERIVLKVKAFLTPLFMLALAALAFSALFGYWNLDYVKQHSEARWREMGFEPVAYEGWQVGTGVPFTKYGGGRVWYRLRNVPDNGITYQGYIKRWGDELHVYGPHAIDAIRPR